MTTLTEAENVFPKLLKAWKEFVLAEPHREHRVAEGARARLNEVMDEIIRSQKQR
jgi:hypothetical protein